MGKEIPSSPVPNKESWSSQDLQSTCQSQSRDETVGRGLTKGRRGREERREEEKDVNGVLSEWSRHLSLEGLQRQVWAMPRSPPGQKSLPFLSKPG